MNFGKPKGFHSVRFLFQESNVVFFFPWLILASCFTVCYGGEDVNTTSLDTEIHPTATGSQFLFSSNNIDRDISSEGKWLFTSSEAACPAKFRVINAGFDLFVYTVVILSNGYS